MKIVVIGCGNIYAGDDGVGIMVAEKLKKEKLPEQVEVIKAGMPGLSLAELIQGASKAIIIDALLDIKHPGDIVKFSAEEIIPEKAVVPWSLHGIGLREALAWIKGVDSPEMPRDISIIGIKIASFDVWQENLSLPVAQAVDKALELIRKEIASFLPK